MDEFINNYKNFLPGQPLHAPQPNVPTYPMGAGGNLGGMGAPNAPKISKQPPLATTAPIPANPPGFGNVEKLAPIPTLAHDWSKHQQQFGGQKASNSAKTTNISQEQMSFFTKYRLHLILALCAAFAAYYLYQKYKKKNDPPGTGNLLLAAGAQKKNSTPVSKEKSKTVKVLSDQSESDSESSTPSDLSDDDGGDSKSEKPKKFLPLEDQKLRKRRKRKKKSKN